MESFSELKKPVRPDRIRSIPRSFSWIDRDLLHHRFLQRLRRDEISVYFFLVLTAGPEGTSFWSYRRIAKLLKLGEDDVLSAVQGLIRHDLIAFRYPTFQVLSLPETTHGHP